MASTAAIRSTHVAVDARAGRARPIHRAREWGRLRDGGCRRRDGAAGATGAAARRVPPARRVPLHGTAVAAPLSCRAARSAAAAAMIRAFRPAGGSTTGTLAARTGSTPPELGDLGVGIAAGREVRAHGGRRRPDRARPARTRRPSRGPRRRSGRGIAIRPGHEDPASSVRRIASRPRRIRLLTVPSGVSVRSAISCWVRPAEVGQLDRLALDVRECAKRDLDRLRVEHRDDLGPHVGERSVPSAAPSRLRGARSSGGDVGRHRWRDGGRSTAATSSRCRDPRRIGRHCATHRGTRPGRRPRRGSGHS